MATIAGKHRHFNDGTRPPDWIPATTSSHESHRASDDSLTQPATRMNKNDGAGGQRSDLSDAAINSEASDAMNIEVDHARVDARRRPDPLNPAPPGLGAPHGAYSRAG